VKENAVPTTEFKKRSSKNEVPTTKFKVPTYATSISPKAFVRIELYNLV